MNQLSFQSPTQAPVPMPVPASPTQQAIAAPAGAQYIDRCTQRLAIEIGERVKATLVQLGTLREVPISRSCRMPTGRCAWSTQPG